MVCGSIRNTTDAVADLVNFVYGSLDAHTDVGALFIDVAKAFDSIDRTITLQKSEYYGFAGLLIFSLKVIFLNVCNMLTLMG